MLVQVWVRDVLEAQQVLDYQTGQRFCKLQVYTLSQSSHLLVLLGKHLRCTQAAH